VHSAALDFEVEISQRQAATVTLGQADRAQNDVIAGH
jgi:hypothetical protein